MSNNRAFIQRKYLHLFGIIESTTRQGLEFGKGFCHISGSGIIKTLEGLF
jgi:hypothetical protein